MTIEEAAARARCPGPMPTTQQIAEWARAIEQWAEKLAAEADALRFQAGLWRQRTEPPP